MKWIGVIVWAAVVLFGLCLIGMSVYMAMAGIQGWGWFTLIGFLMLTYRAVVKD